tara:strand:- start:115 stop:252 length:138 start_codon:yes stop_codon:yes gene_type:complete
MEEILERIVVNQGKKNQEKKKYKGKLKYLSKNFVLLIRNLRKCRK